MHYLDQRQIDLCKAAARVEEYFSDDGTAPRDLIDPILAAGFLRKTKIRKTPYMFTDAGCIAVELWNASFRTSPDPASIREAAAKVAEAHQAPPLRQGGHDPEELELIFAERRGENIAAKEIAAKILALPLEQKETE
jgi:hypothetical protein